MTAFVEWLGQVGLEHCAKALGPFGVDFDRANTLTRGKLRELGLSSSDSRTLLQALGKHAVIAAAGARIQLTVMFCDLAGYSELSQRLDAEELSGIMQDYRNTCIDWVQEYDGYVAEYPGDAVVAYFGTPHAHENDAERSVRAALEIVQAFKAKNREVHIGISTGGPNVVGRDGLVVGPTPTLASRLEDVAKSGQILIDSITKLLIGNTFELTPDKCQLEKIGMLEGWNVSAVRRTEGRFDAVHGGMPLTALVGREEEVRLLLRHWEWACDGEGQIVRLSGEPGIGKSRLTEVLRERIKLKKEPHKTLRYQCSPFRLNSALYPIIEHIEFAAGFARDDSSEDKLRKLNLMLLGSEAQRTESTPLFAALLSLPTDLSSLGLSPARQKEKTLELLVQEVKTLSVAQPVLILFEDAHWIDPTTQELVDLLMPQLRSLPVLMVITHRPEYLPHGFKYPHVAKVELTKLPKQLGSQLIGNITLGKALPREAVNWILDHADGTPLYFEELTRALLESRYLREEESGYRLIEPLPALDNPKALISDTLIPETLFGFLIERLNRPRVRELAQIGACIGREFPHDLLAAVSPYKGTEFEEELQKLTETGLVFRSGTPTKVTYTFKHALVQETAYELLLRSKRPHVHEQIAHALQQKFQDRVTKEPEVLAYHLTQAAVLFEDLSRRDHDEEIARHNHERALTDLTLAIPVWKDAGKLAVARCALQEAVAHHEKGLAILDRLPASADRDGLELSLRRSLHTARLQWHGWAAPEVGVNAEAIVRLEENRERPESLVIGLWGKWVNTLTQGRIAEALPWADRLLAEGRRREDIDMQILGHRGSMFTHFYLGELHEALDHGEKARRLYDQDQSRAEQWIDLVGNDVRTSVGVCTSQAIWMLGEPDLAERVSNQKDDHARKLRKPFDVCWALTWGAYVFDYRHEPKPLLERAEESEKLAIEQSIPVFSDALVPIGKGLARLRDEQFAESIALLRQGIHGWTARGGHLNVPYMKAALAEALARQGDVSAGLSLIEECLEQIERPGWNERVWLPEVLRLKGWMHFLKREFAEAETALGASISCARAQQARSWELRSATTLAKLLVETGRGDAARALLSPVYNWFTEGTETHDLRAAQVLLKTLGVSPSDDLDRDKRPKIVQAPYNQ